MIAQYSPAGITRSELEERFLDLCSAAGIPAPVVNVHLLGYEVDFLWRGEGVVVETDGHAVHGTRTAFESDRPATRASRPPATG